MNAFDIAADELEAQTELNRLQARGVIRLMLKDAGFDASEAASNTLRIVVAQTLPGKLETHGISATQGAQVAEAVCDALKASPAKNELNRGLEAMLDRLESLRSRR
ncbi:MAG: hypothetical protein AAF654_00560 [Myxococcota bacterium]